MGCKVNTKQPLVSIVIPCFNAEKYIGEAIDSALGQSYPHVEVVVIDDGSTDASLNAISSYGSSVRWETGPNHGGNKARNRGIALAKGEFIQFLDADDWLHPEKLQRQMAIAASMEHTLVFCDGQSSPANWSHPHHVRKDDCSDAVSFMLRGGLQTTAPLHRRRWLFEVGGWDETLPCSQERDLHLRVAASGVLFHRLPETLFTVRQVENSISSNDIKVLDQHRRIALNAIKILESRNSLTEERRRAFAAFLARDGRAYIRMGEESKGIQYFRLAKSIHHEGGLRDTYSFWARVVVKLLGPTSCERLRRLKLRAN